jgi:hypothetical protein
MYIEFLLEERSAEATLKNLLPKILGERVGFRLHAYQGKLDLLNKLPDRLQGYCAWMPHDYYIVVLIDADQEDCEALKGELEAIAREAGLSTKSAVLPGMHFQVLNRLAVEELEAWFFGDAPALRAAYPRISANLEHRANYRDPDAIPGGTWEALARLLKYHQYPLPGKITIAESVSEHMAPDRNRSRSFQVFVDGLNAILEDAGIEMQRGSQ